jgi:SAM-dependent methyltransferase
MRRPPEWATRSGEDLATSRTLLRHLSVIAAGAPGPILDAPCGYGRNAIPFAKLGFDVFCVDTDGDALTSIATVQASSKITGRLIPLAADLMAPPTALAIRRFGAVINVHFPALHLLEWWGAALLPGGFLYMETVENRGENYRELPRRDEYRARLPPGLDVLMYHEKPAGPPGSDRVTARVLARKGSGR